MIVVVGGGFAGMKVVKSLERKGKEVTLIDNSPVFEFTPSILKAAVDPEMLKNIQVYHKSHLKCRFIQGKVSDVKKDKVLVNGKKVVFENLVIATGGRPRHLGFEAEAVYKGEDVKKTHQKITKAKDILIVGGGYVGVELAAEIIETFPKKKVVLVHPHSNLMNRQPGKTGKLARNFLEKKGVKIILGRRIKKQEGNYYFTDDGRKIKSDLVFNCTGTVPNSEAFKDFLEVDKSGRVIVDEFLRAKGFKNIYAIGDVNNIPEEKTAHNAEKQARTLVKTLLREKLKRYVPRDEPMVTSLGRWNGIFSYKGLTFGGIIPAILKPIIEWKVLKKIK